MPKKILLLLLGTTFLIAGMVLVLKNWDAIVFVFRAGIGMVLAVGGLVILSFIKEGKP